ncbi:hypothetical protein ACH5RR_023391 [Cinchona calisaya]|uniref:Uncharacterized protein n=1 Tax=Cinchona calisaya TaxID=153742 RepID=A0ABD2ZC26_9GENT
MNLAETNQRDQNFRDREHRDRDNFGGHGRGDFTYLQKKNNSGNFRRTNRIINKIIILKRLIDLKFNVIVVVKLNIMQVNVGIIKIVMEKCMQIQLKILVINKRCFVFLFRV